MEVFFAQILSVLVTPPGSLAYHLVLAFSVAGAFQIAVSAWQKGDAPYSRRWLLGLGALLVLQLVQFIAAALGWQELIAARTLLPPVDRGVTLLSLLVLAWLWSFPRAARLGDSATGLLLLLGIVGTIFGITWWGQQDPGLTFNQTWFDFGLQLFGVLLAGAAVLGLVLRRPQGWGFGAGMLGLLLTGHLLQAWLVPEGDFTGVVRLFQMAGYPFLLLMPHSPFTIHPEYEAPIDERRMPGKHQILELSLIREFSQIVNEQDPNLFCRKISRSISTTMLADYCLLISLPDSKNQMKVMCGYNLIQEHYVDSFTLDGNLSPMITNSMKRGRPVRLTSANDSPEAYGLAGGLGIKRLGHLMHVPVCKRGSPALMGILLITPYSNRAWTTDDQLGLVGSSEVLANILSRIQAGSEDPGAMNQMQDTVSKAQQAETLARREVVEWQAKADRLNQQLNEARKQVESLASMIENQEIRGQTGEQRLVDTAGQVSNIGMREIVSLDEYRYLETELERTLEEMAALKNLLAASDQKILEQQALQPTSLTKEMVGDLSPVSEQSEVIASLAQELRQPMSSIVGYTDLLLGESVGILGATQRKFLERVKASIERMGALVDDLIQTSTMQSSELELSPELVDLNTIIDDAVANSIARLREKNILLRMDLPDRLPLVRADRDALQQILLHLLQNAGAATPVEGEILLRAQVEHKEDQPSFILVQVADSGGGIPPGDLPRVFSRLYRADNALIQGVGDTGVGLSIVKALVEAHGGRVWVDSILDVGSTFSVLLPLSDGAGRDHEAGVV